MKKNELVPERRFEGFTGEWEEKKLEDVAPLQRGFDLTRPNISKGPYPVIFSNGIGAWNSIYKIKGPGVITGRSGSIGNVSYIEQNYWPHNTSLWVTNFFENYPLYIYYLYQKVDLSKFGTGSGVPTLNRNDVHDYFVFVPSAKEQQKIGQFFKQLDEMIAIQQRKIDKTKALKSAYLVEMFPAEGEHVPKRRFAGFTDEWKENKLSFLTDYHNGKSHEKNQALAGKYELINLNSISIDGGLKPSGKYVDEATELLKKNDLVMILSDVGHGDLLGRVAIIPEDNKYVLNQRVALLRPKKIIDPAFLFSLINSNQKYFKDKGAGMSQLNISKSIVEEFVVLAPSLKEQQKIGQFFKHLDEMIATHQQKLEKLKATKQAYLHEMFV